MSGTIRGKTIVLDTSTTIDKKINLSSSELTISGGEVTITTSYHTITPESGPSDDLDTINGGVEGDMLFLRCAANKQVTLKNGTGNILLVEDHLLVAGASAQLFYDGTNWTEISISRNKGPTLAASGITVDNANQANRIILTFSKNLETTSAENTSNYTVTNNAGSITYNIASASLSGRVVTLTLATVNPDDNTSFITTTDANAGIKVTPTSNIVDLLDSSYSGATVFDNGGTVIDDTTAPTLDNTAIKIDNTNDPNTIELTFSEKMDKTTSEDQSNFTVTNSDNTITYILTSSSLNNQVITLTLDQIDTDRVGTYITNNDATTGIKVLPSTSLLDVSGYPYNGDLVTGVANDADHILDSTPPTLDTSNIRVFNDRQPNMVNLTFSEKMTKLVGEDVNNWVIKNHTNTINYKIDNAAVSGNIVSLTLAEANSYNTSTYITTTDANAGLRVTPNTNITDVAGVNYIGGKVNGDSNDNDHEFDEDAPTIPVDQIQTVNTTLPNRLYIGFDEKVEKTQVETISNWNVTNTGGAIGYSLANATLDNGTDRHVTITLVPVDTSNNRTFITNSDANAGLIVTASSAITDLAGNQFNGIAVTESGTDHVLNTTSPVLAQANIQVDTTVRPHQITLTFDEPMDKTLGEDETNWTVIGGSNATSYNIASASVANAVVTLTLAPVNTAEANSYITSDEVSGIQVTPSSNLKNAYGASYTGGQITESGGSHNPDVTAPVLPSSGIAVDNVSDPQTITLTFTEPLRKIQGEVTSNWNVTNLGASQGYTISSASVNNSTVVLTLPTADSGDKRSYITNNHANIGLVITPDTNIIDVYGVSYVGGPITGVANESNHTLNLTAPVLIPANVNVYNTSDNNHLVGLKFSQKIEQTSGETVSNMIVTNNTGALQYSIKQINLSNENLTVVLDDCNASNNQTFITNNHATQGVKVTPSSNITNLAGIGYSGIQVTGNGTDNNLDDTAPTVELAYNAPGVGTVTKVKQGSILTITASFSEKILDAYPPQIQHSANGPGAIPILQPALMTKTSDNEWFYNYTVPSGNGSIYPTLLAARDLPGKDIVPNPTSGKSIYIDNTSPTISAITPSFGDRLNLTEDNSSKTVLVTAGAGLSGLEDGQNIYIKITDDALVAPADYVHMNNSTLLAAVSSNNATITLNATDLQALTDGKTYSISVVNAIDVTTYSGTVALNATTDLAGNEYTGTTSTQFTYDITRPTLPANSIQVNNSVQPNQITLTFTEELTTASANNVSNYTIKDNSNTITYGLVSANKTGNAVTIVMDPIDPDDDTTFITNSAIGAGIRVTPSTNLQDLAGNAYNAGPVLESGATHTTDSNDPTFLAGDVIIDNSVQPNTIVVTFDQKMDVSTAETEGNWTVTNNSNGIQYAVANAALSANTVVTLTLADVDSSNNKTFITTSDISSQLRITPSTSITNVVGTASLGAEVVASNSGHTLDTTAPTLDASNIVVDNTSRPQTVTVTFSEAVDKTTADTVGNWTLGNGAYTINTAVASNATVVLTLHPVDSSNSQTFITNSDASGITVTPSTNIVDLCGANAYSGGQITEFGATHVLDEDSPTLAYANIQVNNSVRPNQITITFNEEVTKSLAEDTGNWAVANSTGALSYTLASASANNNVVVLTMAAVNTSDNSTFILNSEAPSIRVTPSANITDLSGANAYADGTVTASNGSHTLDSTAPTLAASDISVNTSVRPNTISVTFSEPVTTGPAENISNWAAANSTGLLSYTLDSASANNNTVVLTMAAVDSSDKGTFILNSEAPTIRVTPGTNITDIAGTNAYSSGAVTASGGSHTLDSDGPTLPADNIQVNNSVQPNQITLTFDEPVDKDAAEDPNNWNLVKDSTNTIAFNVASASANNAVVTLTLATVNPADNTSFITNNQATAGLRITPNSTYFKDVAGVTYSDGTVVESGASHTVDNDPPSFPASGVVIDNTVQPNTITITFNQKLDLASAETEGYWSVANNSGGITYSVANAALSNNIVTLTLANIDSTSNGTYITTTHAGEGIKITPSTSLLNVVGKPSAGDEIVAQTTGHTLDSTGPILPGANIQVNNRVRPHQIILTFNESLEKDIAESINNWEVRDNTEVFKFELNSASVSNNVVTLTMNESDSSVANTHITNAQASAGIKVTPSQTIVDLHGNSYTGGKVQASGSNILDITPATIDGVDIDIDNTSTQHTITVQSSEKLNKASAETVSNWTVTSESGGNGITYVINSASATNDTVELTLPSITITNEIGSQPNTAHYITNTAAQNGIYVTCSSSVTDLQGVFSAGTEVRSNGTNTLDSGATLAPNLFASNTVDPNVLYLVFDKDLDSTYATNPNNWIVTNNDGTITYAVDNATQNSSYSEVLVSLAAVNAGDNTTYFTNSDITDLKITPSSNVTTFLGASYTNGTITKSGGTTNTTSAPTVDLTYQSTGNSPEVLTIARQGDTVRIGATFNNLIAATPSVQISHNASGSVSALSATDMTRSNDTYWIYDYTIPSGDGTITFELSTGKDIYGNNVPTNPASGATFIVDNTSPTASLAYNISGIGIVNSAKQGEVVRVTATFNEQIAEDPAMQIQHAANGTVGLLSATDMTRLDGTTWYYDYTIPSGNGVANLTLSTGTDLAGNVITSEPTSGGSLTIDNNAPSASLSYSITGIGAITHARQGQTVRVTATFDQAIQDSPVPQIQHASSGTVSALAATDMTKVSSTEYYYDYTIPVGDGTVNPTLSTGLDSTRNEIQATPTSGTDLVIDNTAPSILSFVTTGVLANGILDANERATLVANGTSTSLIVTMNPSPYNIEDGVANSGQVLFAGTTYKNQFASNAVTIGIPDNKLISTYDSQSQQSTVYPLTITCSDKAGNSVVDSSSYSITINKF